jgi:hypothetical protein
MIRRQQTVVGNSLPDGVADLGACILRIAVELDRRMFTGVSLKAALDQMKALPRGFPREVIEALEGYSPPPAAFEFKWLKIPDLRASMIIEGDIVTKGGNFMILRKGTVLNATALDRIRNFDTTRGICQPIHVQVPQMVKN